MVLLAEKTLHSGRIFLVSLELLLHLREEGLSLGDLAKQLGEESRFGAGGTIGGRDEEVVIEDLRRVERDLRDVRDGGVGRHDQIARERLEMLGVGLREVFD